MKKNNPAHILIVDDTAQNIQVLGTILAKEGFDIYVAQNGLQALEKVEGILPDLILLDILMPELDGFETCKRLKASSVTKDIPIIFLTAKTEMEDIIKGFDLGAVDYVTKPFNPKELLVRVQTHLQLKFSQDMLNNAHNEMKELVHVLCHDLANPLNNVVAVLDTINTYSKFEEFKGLLKTSAENGLNIINLIKDMRDLAENDLVTSPVNLSRAVAISAQILSHAFTHKKIELEIDVQENINVLAEEVSLINSVLNNLLTNSIKFSYPESKVMVKSESLEDKTILTITDFGIGMPQQITDNLFDINCNTTRIGTNEEKGNGFGMPLVSKFITAYGGHIDVSSVEEETNPNEHGTIFTLTFQTTPLATDSDKS